MLSYNPKIDFKFCLNLWQKRDLFESEMVSKPVFYGKNNPSTLTDVMMMRAKEILIFLKNIDKITVDELNHILKILNVENDYNDDKFIDILPTLNDGNFSVETSMINSIKNEKGLFETMLNIVDIKGVYYFTLFTTAFYGAKYLIGLASRNKKLVEDATGYFEKTFPKFIRSILENTYVGLLFLSDCIRAALMFTNSISHPLSFVFNVTLTATSEKNYRHNIIEWANILEDDSIDAFATLERFGSIRFINNQNNPVFYNIHYGFSNICDSGCGIIATYNALRALGKIDEDFFPKLIYLFESKNLVFGKIGALPSEIRSILHDMYNVSFISVYNLNDVIGPNSLLRDTSIEYGLIATFFNNQENVSYVAGEYYEDLLGMHTVCYLATNISSNNNLYQGLNNPDSSGLTVSNIFKSREVFKDGIIFEVSANEE